MIKNPLQSGVSNKSRRKRVIARIEVLTPLLEETNRMPSVLKSIRNELATLKIELQELNALIEPQTHHARPSWVKRGESWVCSYCKTINLYDNPECKMILQERRRVETAVNKNHPQSMEFWDFLD